jgi:hypothetical protein
MKIEDLKKKSGVKFFASIFGKATINKNSFEYKTIESATEVLINNGYGVIHGGYAGGAMSAVSDTANRLIKEKKLPKELNIGIPQKEHDGLWSRVNEASFVDVAEDIYMRLKSVSSGDIALVCPLGGDGTELEENIVFHENVVREGINKYTKEKAKKTIPLIFLQTPKGTNWKKIIETKINLLDNDRNNISDYSWLYFVNSIKEFEKLIISF